MMHFTICTPLFKILDLLVTEDEAENRATNWTSTRNNPKGSADSNIMLSGTEYCHKGQREIFGEMPVREKSRETERELEVA